MLNEVRYVPGAADARIQQPFDYPNLTVNVDRTRAAGDRPDAAECGAEPAGGAERQLPDHAQLLSRSRKWRDATTSPFRLRSTGSIRWRRSKSLPVTRSAGTCAAGQTPPVGTGSSASADWRPTLPGAPQQPVQVLGNLAAIRARRGTGHGQPLRRAAGDRYLYQRGWNRPGQRDARRWRRSSTKHQKQICRAARTSSCAGRARP